MQRTFDAQNSISVIAPFLNAQHGQPPCLCRFQPVYTKALCMIIVIYTHQLRPTAPEAGFRYRQIQLFLSEYFFIIFIATVVQMVDKGDICTELI